MNIFLHRWLFFIYIIFMQFWPIVLLPGDMFIEATIFGTCCTCHRIGRLDLREDLWGMSCQRSLCQMSLRTGNHPNWFKEDTKRIRINALWLTIITKRCTFLSPHVNVVEFPVLVRSGPCPQNHPPSSITNCFSDQQFIESCHCFLLYFYYLF